MNKQIAFTLLLAATLVFLLPWPAASQPTVGPEIARQLPEDTKVLAVKIRTVEGQKFTFVKTDDREGNVKGHIFDSGNRRVRENQVPRPQPRRIGKLLKQRLERTTDRDAEIEVSIALQAETLDDPGPPVSGTAEMAGTDDDVDAGRVQLKVTLDGQELSVEQLEAREGQRISAARTRLRANRQRVRDRLRQLAQRHGWTDHPAFKRALDDDRSSIDKIKLTRREIQTLIRRSGDLIAGVDLYIEPEDQITGAMKSSQVDPYAINYSGRKGNGIGIYMTESGCPNAGHITRYTRLGGSRTDHSENVSAIMRAVSPESHIYCRGGATLPTIWDYIIAAISTPIYVANRSNGSGDNDDYITRDRDWDNYVYNWNVATFVSAGNYGDDNGYIMSPAKGLNIISVGAYSDSNDTIAAFSSYIDPETGNDKPELSAPGVSITAGGHTKSGTSMSSPHATAFAADLMGRYTVLKRKPYLMKAHMISGAWKSITGGSDKVGLGAIDFYRTYYSYYYHWWDGGNNSFSYFDSTTALSSPYNDPLPGNGYIDSRWVYIPASRSKVRIVLVWMNRGSYTYNHRNASHPIGMDLDMRVYDPNGKYVRGSASWDNPYESVEFDPTVSGVYRVAINRYANRDTSSKLQMGLLYQW